MRSVLVADDEKNIRSTVATTLRLEGYRVETAADGAEALAAAERGSFDLVMLDLQMPVMNGLDALRALRARGDSVPVIFLSAHGTIGKAVEAVRLGAYDFIEKPPNSDRILLAVRNALRQAALEDENRELRGDEEARFEMVGDSQPMLELYEMIERAAPTQARVLILGENGTGKELIARALHRLSPRRAGPFVRVNCAAVPRDLFESELFGHEKGAFTGAASRRRGKFARADGGTLFLDEVGEIPRELQSKLLRALESGEIEPVGAEREIQVDARVVAATNRDIDRAVRDGEFREDLYYRLQVVTITAPPLRARKQDIPGLVRAFLREACEDNHLQKRIPEDAVSRIARHDFPGNVRELRNLVERLVILTPGETIDTAAVERCLPASSSPARGLAPQLGGTLRDTMARLEREVVLGVLEAEAWRMSAAAEQLGLERSHLYKKLKALGIERPE